MLCQANQWVSPYQKVAVLYAYDESREHVCLLLAAASISQVILTVVLQKPAPDMTYAG